MNDACQSSDAVKESAPLRFDPNFPHYVPAIEMQKVIGNAWIAQFRGAGIISRLIQYTTGGVHSHSAMLRRNNGHVDVLELREFHGGRARPLVDTVRDFPGQIDVFSPDLKRWPEFQAKNATEVMRYFTGRKYSYWGVCRLFMQRVPVIRRLWPLDMSDHDIADADNVGAPFCSHAVCAATRIGGGVDPVPRLRDDLVTPSTLTWSLFYKYEGTLC